FYDCGHPKWSGTKRAARGITIAEPIAPQIQID
ncbi:MAG: hypothetical protein ACI9VS_001938, partial [Candidatus Binatia bacterium]